MIAIAALFITIGLWLIASALMNWEWYLGIFDFAFIESILGDQAARWACGLAGLALVVTGDYYPSALNTTPRS